MANAGEMERVAGEALDFLDEAGDAFGDIASACEFPIADAAAVDASDLRGVLDELLDVLAAVRKAASDADWKYDQQEKRLRKESGL